MGAARQPSPTGAAQVAPRLPREVWVLVVVIFVIAIGYGIVAPALPTFARSFDVSVTAASIVVSAFAFMRLAFAPASGKLISAFGERPVYVWGITLVGLSTGACAFAAGYWQLLVLRALGGIGSTMFTVSAIALLIRLTPPALRGRSTGLWSAGFLLGGVTGPLVGAGLITISLRAPFVVYAVALFIAATVAWLFLRRSTLVDAIPAGDVPALTVREALGHPAYRAALVSNFAHGWALFGVRVSLVPLFVVEVLHRGASLAGLALSVFAVGNVATLMFSGRLADSIGRRRPMVAGLVVTGSATIWLGFTGGVPEFLAAALIAGAGTGLIAPAQGATVADVIGSQAKGGPVLAAFQMTADIGAILGPITAGLLADHLSYSAAFAVTGAISLLAAVAWLRAPETLPQLQDRTATDLAAECGCLDEGPEVPTGQRISGRARQPED
ncbi:MAG TPA: MFS transporter [Pseudonocardiaceae bacterium]|nr:MFS transporter [Pseudonocardiaceae bacterium]